MPCPRQIPELFNTFISFFFPRTTIPPPPLPLSPLSGGGCRCIGLAFGICGSSSLPSVIASSIDRFGFLAGVCSMVSLPLVHLILNGSRSRCLVSVRMMRSWSLLALFMNLFFVASMPAYLVPRLLVFQVVILICYVTVCF